MHQLEPLFNEASAREKNLQRNKHLAWEVIFTSARCGEKLTKQLQHISSLSVRPFGDDTSPFISSPRFHPRLPSPQTDSDAQGVRWELGNIALRQWGTRWE